MRTLASFVLNMVDIHSTTGAAARLAADSSGSGSLSQKIGEHSYYCLSSGFCTPEKGSFFGLELNVDTIAMTVIVMGLILVLALVVRSSLSVEKPRGLQNGLEAIFDFVNDLVSDNLGVERIASIGPLAVALFLFILVSNWIGLIATPFPWFHAPTSDLNTTLALAILIIVLVHTLGARIHKGRYLGHVFEYPALAPLTFIEEISKPITLSFRLFGNIFAGEVLILVFGSLLGGILTVAVLPFAHGFALALGLFVGAIQAFIFTVLSVAYIGISTATAEGHETADQQVLEHSHS